MVAYHVEGIGDEGKGVDGITYGKLLATSSRNE
jgi:hypothetical protein